MKTNASTTTGHAEALGTDFMTSWEMSKEVNKSHANVLRDIRRRLQSRGIDHEKYRTRLLDHRGYRRWIYALPRGLAVELMACYSTTICGGQEPSVEPNQAPDLVGTTTETRLNSREIAALVDLPHRRVLRDIRRVLQKRGEAEAMYRNDRPDGRGVYRPVIELPRHVLVKLPYYNGGVGGRWVELNKAWLEEQALLNTQRIKASIEARRNAQKSIPLRQENRNGHNSKDEPKSATPVINVTIRKRTNFIK